MKFFKILTMETVAILSETKTKKTVQNSKRKSRINNAVNIKGGTDGQI